MTAFTPSVSIVMATYNGAVYLPRQLRSLAEQTLLPLELLVSDDDSNDSTIDIIETFARNAPFSVKIKRQTKRLGHANNFLSAAQLCSGDVIAFCDQDDVWYKNKLEVCVETLKRDQVGLCAHAVDLIDGSGQFIGKMPQNLMRRRGTRELAGGDPWWSLLGMSEVFDRNLLDIFGSDELTRGLDPDTGAMGLGHDKWIAFLAEAFGGLSLISESLAAYRLHDSNASMTNDGLRRRSVQISRMIGLPAHTKLNRAQIAAHRSQLLTEASGRDIDETLRQKLHHGAKKWLLISRYEDRRTQLYDDDDFVSRLKEFVRLIISGCYRSNSVGGMGRLLSVKDFIVGVLRTRKVKI